MPLKLFRLTLAFFLIFSSRNLFPQNTEYVKLDAFSNRDKYTYTDTIKIALRISIGEKYHINSYKVEDPTLIKTSVTGNSDKFKLLNTYFPKDKKHDT